MEEYKPVVTPETASSEEDTSDSKSKKKKKAIGTFVVEAEPQSPLDKLLAKSRKDDKAKKESTPESAEDQEILEPAENNEVISQLAAARLQELQSTAEFDAVDPTEQEAVETYLAAAQSEGDIAAAYDETINGLAANEPEQEVSEALTTQEHFIDPTTPSEGEIPLENEVHTPQTPPPTIATGGSSGGAPPPIFPGNRPAPFEDGGDNFARQPTFAATESVIPVSDAAEQARQAQNEGLVVGALVGYLVGRRRGRIKTEKRLQPLQKKLEKQVKNLQHELLATETQVRQKVREQYVAAPVERTQAIPEVNEKRRSSGVVPPERIGHVIMTANAGAERKTSSPANKPEAVSARKKAESMSREQLLAVSEKVSVEGTTLRKIYETQLLGEKGLRRLVAEHLRGGNVSRALRRELVEREIDFERDPILRDKDHGGGSDAAGKAALAAMLAKAGATPDQDEGAVIGVRPSSNATKPETKATKQSPVTNAADLSLLTLITVLTLAILFLLFRG